MKKPILLLGLLLVLPFFLYAQEILNLQNAENSPCSINQSENVIDGYWTIRKDAINIVEDSLNYLEGESSDKKLGKADYDTRLIYFVHGLGGNDKSWDAVDDAHTNEFVYTPLRVDYEAHQRDFDEASYEVYLEMNRLRLEALYANGQVLTTDKPYAIGHSQGGLVLRDMDHKFRTNYDAHFKEDNRQFYGIVTFGTPHLGARIAVSQNELAKLGSDFSYYLGNAAIKNEIAKFSVKLPFFSNKLTSFSQSASQLFLSLSDGFIEDGIRLLSKGQQAPMAQQYGPNSSYIKQHQNISNTNTAKALFYGIESDPLLFKIATYMIGPGASDFVHYPRFGANDDMNIAHNMNEVKGKLQADIGEHKKELEKLKKRLNYTNIPIVGMGFLLTKQSKLNKIQLQEEAIQAEEDAISFINKANGMYKTIIGAVDIRRLFSRKLTGYWCVTSSIKVNISPSWLPPNYITVTQKHRITDKNLCDGNQVIPIYETPSVEEATDAVVPISSQMGFPGCLPQHKHLMNEVRIYKADGSFSHIAIKSDVNHIQMINCSQTDEALRRVYEGRGVPQFFKLTEKK